MPVINPTLSINVAEEVDFANPMPYTDADFRLYLGGDCKLGRVPAGIQHSNVSPP